MNDWERSELTGRRLPEFPVKAVLLQLASLGMTSGVGAVSESGGSERRVSGLAEQSAAEPL